MNSLELYPSTELEIFHENGKFCPVAASGT